MWLLTPFMRCAKIINIIVTLPHCSHALYFTTIVNDSMELLVNWIMMCYNIVTGYVITTATLCQQGIAKGRCVRCSRDEMVSCDVK